MSTHAIPWHQRRAKCVGPLVDLACFGTTHTVKMTATSAASPAHRNQETPSGSELKGRASRAASSSPPYAARQVPRVGRRPGNVYASERD